MFGAQGQAQSRDFAFHIATICGAPVRMSYFVLFVFALQCVQIGQSSQKSTTEWIGFNLLYAAGSEFLLLFTVLCHEFGHGNMARYLGGNIDHILLWVFGGICFSSRPQGVIDNVKLLRNDLLIVGAGPATHFLQAPAWGLVMGLLFVWISHVSEFTAMQTFGHDNPLQIFFASLNPIAQGLNSDNVLAATYSSAGIWLYLLWMLAISAIYLNVTLFLFNVFFPMYPADGAKLLVTGCMFCCGMPPRKAALFLICTTVPCALLMIGYSVYSVYNGVSRGQGISGMMGSLMGYMALMGLAEAYRIWQLREARLLHQHALFQTARSWGRREHDGQGLVSRINVAEFDDEQPLNRGGMCASMMRSCRPEGGWSCAGCLGCLLPCLFRPRAREVTVGGQAAGTLWQPFTGTGTPLGTPASPDQLRNERLHFLGEMDRQAVERQRTVRDYMDETYGRGDRKASATAAVSVAPVADAQPDGGNV